MKYRSVSIVIPTFNGKELLKKFLPSVIAASKFYKETMELIIVDDGSSDGSGEFIKKKFPGARLIELEKNIGFARACNKGFWESRNDIVILLNNDMLVAKDFIEYLIPHFNEPDIFCVRPALRLLTKDADKIDLRNFMLGLRFKRGFIELPMLRIKEIPKPFYYAAISGGAGAFDREKLRQLEGFDDIFAPFYWEDADLSYRAWKRGWKIIFEPASLVYHQTHSTIPTIYKKRYIETIGERNRYLLVWKNILDKRLLSYHLLWIPIRLVTCLLQGKWWKILSFLLALKQIKKIIIRRKIERREQRVRDREIFSLFSNITKGSKPFFTGK